MTYIQPLDGVRAIAILAVLIFHVSPAALTGGFTGVDVFYVLSGFLITSIIVRDIREGSFSIAEFYIRRVQRLLPNIVVMVSAVLLLWTLFLPASMGNQVGHHGLWTLFNLSNIYAWKSLGGYWGNAADLAPLTHTWSLGIEEQFYLLFPGALLLLTRFQPGRLRFWLIVGTVLSFAICLYGTYSHPVATFYLLPTRVWELLLGAVVAAHRTALRGAERRGELLGENTREALGWTGLCMIVIGFVAIDESSHFPGLVSLAPTAGTAFVLVSVVDGQTRLSRMLSLPFMVGIGKLSYSLYLWHWPLITFGKILANIYGISVSAGAVAGGLISILVSWSAYIFVERPLRKRGAGRSWRLVTIAAGLSVAVLSCGLAAFRPLVADPDHQFDSVAFYGTKFNAGRRVDPKETTSAVRYFDVHFPSLTHESDDAWRTGGVVRLYGGGRPKVVVLGSSHALVYSRLIDDLCREMGLSVAFLGVDQGTPAFLETTRNGNFSSQTEASEFDDARRKWLREWRPTVVFAIDRWDVRFSTPQAFNEKLKAFLHEVGPLATRVVFVSQVPVVGLGNEVNLREIATWYLKTKKSLPIFHPDSRELIRKQSVTIAEASREDFPNLRVLRVDLPFYRDDESIRYAAGRTFYYADDDHLTDMGTEVVRGLFQRAIIEAVTSERGGNP